MRCSVDPDNNKCANVPLFPLLQVQPCPTTREKLSVLWWKFLRWLEQNQWPGYFSSRDECEAPLSPTVKSLCDLWSTLMVVWGRALRGCDFIYEFIDAMYCHFFYRGRSELSFGWHIRHTQRSPCGDVALHHFPQLRSCCAAPQYSDWNRRCTSMPTSDPLLLSVVLSEHQVRTKKLFTEAHHCVGVANCSVTQKPFLFIYFGTTRPTNHFCISGLSQQNSVCLWPRDVQFTTIVNTDKLRFWRIRPVVCHLVPQSRMSRLSLYDNNSSPKVQWAVVALNSTKRDILWFPILWFFLSPHI